MLKNCLKIASISMATTLALSVTAQNAEALDFTFSGFTAQSLSASGTFRISDTAVASGIVNSGDILDWVINVDTGGTNDYTLLGDGGGFGMDNSDITIFTSGSVSGSTLSLDSAFCISADGDPTCTGNQLLSVNNFDILGDGSSSSATGAASTVLEATAVPFGVAPNTGLGILAGIWGVSRLRKVSKGRRSLSK